MTITKERRPYELLFRWNPDGTFSGGQIQFRELILEDGAILHETLSPAIPVSHDDTEFPLAEIMSDMQRAAIADATQAKIQVARLSEQVTTLQAQLPSSDAAQGNLADDQSGSLGISSPEPVQHAARVDELP